jgi:membrane protein implicated in regulation of membrane protease activity
MTTDNGLIGTVLAVAGGMPLVLAEAAAPVAPQANGIVIPVWALSMLVTIILGLLSFLLKRSLDQVDKTLEKLDARVGDLAAKVAPLDARISNLEHKVEKE